MTRHKTVYLVGVAIRAWSSILQISFPVFSALAWDTNTTASDITEKIGKEKFLLKIQNLFATPAEKS